MSGLKDWFDVFRCGTHLDHSGTLRTITESDIDRAIRSYRRGSVPVVIGHPTLNAPAFGWIDSFRRVGSTVQARCSQVADEFTDAVKRGLYKNRSLSFNRDGSFRHVGFLGAAAPAVKGLEEIQFSDSGDYITMEFAENEAAGAEVQSAAEVPAAEAAEPEKEAETEPVKADKAAAAEGPSQKVQADVKLTIEALTRKVQDLENKLSQEQTQRRKIEFAAYADDLIRDRRLEASCKDKLLSTMEALHAGDAASFADPVNNSLNTFKELLNEVLPQRPRVSFVEFAAPERAGHVDVQHMHPEEIAQCAQRLIEQNRIKGVVITASDAVNKIVGGKGDA